MAIMGLCGLYHIKESNIDIRNNIILMDKGQNIDHSKFILVDGSDNVKQVLNSICFDYIECRTKEYSIFDLMLQRDRQYREVVSYYFDIDSGKEVDRICHSQLQKEWDESSWFADTYYAYDGKRSICLETYVNRKLTDYTYVRSGYVIYNMDSQKIDETENVLYFKEDYHYLNEWIYPQKSMKNPILCNQYLLINETYYESNDLKYDMQYTSWYKNTWCETMGVPLVMLISDLPRSNKALYDEFPDLLEAKNDLSMQDYYVILIFPYSMNADEVVKMITEEGHEVSYEGVYVPEEYSIDEQRHDVDSFEEYMQYLKVEE